MKYILVAIMVLLLMFGYRYRHFFAIDGCLDAGGAWDEASAQCSKSQPTDPR